MARTFPVRVISTGCTVHPEWWACVDAGPFPFETSFWPAIAAALPKPWPREAVVMDLRWYGQVCRRKDVRRPGRRRLAERWGWSEGRARRAIEAAGRVVH